MSYLIFCSFEVGGFPFKMAETLNRHGVKTYYISLAQGAKDHNSTEFHYKKGCEEWDLSYLFLQNNRGDDKHNIELLREIVPRYDIVHSFAVGHKSYLLKEAGISYKYWSYGSDIDHYNPRALVFLRECPFWRNPKLYLYYLTIFRNQRKKSVVNADFLMILSYQLDICKRRYPGKRLFFLPHLVNVVGYEELRRSKLESKKKICESIGAENYLFSPTRHFWFGKNAYFSDYKGNDVILYSFMNYLKRSGDKTSKLILVEKGPDVIETQKLIQSLGISKYIAWVKEMPRDELSVYYRGASVCFGQFGTPALTYAALEPLSNAVPCVSFMGDNDDEVPFYNTMPPILNSRDSEDIASFVIKIMSDTDFSSDISRRSWVWAKENCSEEQFVKSFVKEVA